MMFFLCGRKNKRAGRLWSEATQRPCPLCVVVMRVLFRFSINKLFVLMRGRGEALIRNEFGGSLLGCEFSGAVGLGNRTRAKKNCL